MAFWTVSSRDGDEASEIEGDGGEGDLGCGPGPAPRTIIAQTRQKLLKSVPPHQINQPIQRATTSQHRSGKPNGPVRLIAITTSSQ